VSYTIYRAIDNNILFDVPFKANTHYVLITQRGNVGKSKTPFFSLGAKGTIADTLTSQARGNQTLLRSKPIPANPRSLNQTYQRWHYEDYAYLWKQQTEATRREYAAAGVRFHLTGIQYWMKTHLTDLTDILALYHLDYLTAGEFPDSSKNNYPAVNFGSSPAKGLIANGTYIDGINDWLRLGWPNVIIPDSAYTIELFCQPENRGAVIGQANSNGAIGAGFFTYLSVGYTSLEFYHYQGDGAKIQANSPTPDGGINHVALRYNGSNLITCFANGLPGTPVAVVGFSPCTTSSLKIGRYSHLGSGFLKATVDHAGIYLRALTDTEIYRHSQRRYSLQ